MLQMQLLQLVMNEQGGLYGLSSLSSKRKAHFDAILRRMRLMIFPDRVLGSPGAHCT